jgi:hypothetical protein
VAGQGWGGKIEGLWEGRMKATFGSMTLVAVLLGVPSLCFADTTPTAANFSDYYVYQSLPVALGTTSTGKIQILKDARIKGLKAIPLDIDGPAQVQYRPAQLRLLDSSGKQVDLQPLKKSMASIKISAVDGPGPTFEVTVDYSLGWGTYNGPITSFATIHHGRLLWLEAADPDGSHKHIVKLLENTRSRWKVKDPHTFLRAFTHPNMKGIGNILELARYSLEGNQWIEHSLSKNGPDDFELPAFIPSDSEYP